jgi:hypothetical protein
MSASLRDLKLLASVGLCALALSACASGSSVFPSFSNPFQSQAPAPEPTAVEQPAIPSQYRPEEIVGRWGYGAYHNDADLARTATAARGQCGQPVVINRGPNGGVMMYLADSADLQELVLKGSQSGKNYIGPSGDPGGPQDREIVSFDGRTMVLRWMDPEVAGRYGIGVYVRCAPEGTTRVSTAKRPPRPAPPPPPPPGQ